MPFFSLSLRKPGRVGEPKTTFNAGELEPAAGEAVEVRLDETAYSSPLAFWSDYRRLVQRIRELGEPRPEFVGPPLTAFARVTENGVVRITEDDVVRVVEAA